MHAPRTGFTLLEMLLTLAMSVVLMGLVSAAIGFYARDMENAEQHFRQTQLAASILQMIEDDLRQTLVTRPAETEALADVLSSAAAPLEALGVSSPTGDDSELSSLPPNETTTDPSLAVESLDVLSGGTVLLSPGLIGDASQLQIDVSRLPSLESYAVDPDLIPIDAGGGLTDRPSDIKTVAYFVVPDGEVGPTDALATLAATASSDDVFADMTATPQGGLVRRELDRAISSQAALTGGLSRLLSTGDVIAAEVASIQFEYFDGINWLPQYSSDELGYLPQAIRVSLTMKDAAGVASTTAISDEETPVFSHLIYLPFSHPEDGEALLEESMSGDAAEVP